MSPSQRALARHALGLPNREGVSFKNAAGAFASERERVSTLRSMVEARLARPFRPAQGGRILFFEITRAGAERALEPGERLDPRDFPPIGQD